MGEFKPLLKIAGESALGIAAVRMRKAGVEKIIVVAGHNGKSVVREANRLHCAAVYNPDYESGMFSSVRAGVASLPGCTGTFYVLPVDTPLVKPSTYSALYEAFRASGGKFQAAYPTFMGERAHPPLVSSSLIEPILSWSGESGLRGFLAGTGPAALDVPVADRAVTLDMDTPDEFRRLTDYAESEFFPDDEECVELLRIAGAPERVALHARAVADSAILIGRALSEAGVSIDMRLLRSACLLHDIAKGRKDHEAQGARLLRRLGYAKAARIVASHKELPPRLKIGEAEVLYLSDKMTDGASVSSLEDRMRRMEARFSGPALENARRRIDAALLLRKKTEDITGMTIEKILGGAGIG
jgi:CTP:molybdopterin cytidylyltransferase MocA